MSKNIAENAAALLLAQIASYVLPLATFPYLVRVLGQNGFGRYSMAVAFAGYLQFMIEYGFGLTATSNAARVRNNSFELSKLFWTVGASKIILFIFGFALLQVLSFLLTQDPEIRKLNALACLSAAGSAFFPTWLFQGLEKMKLMSGITLGIRSIGAVGIFLLVRSSSMLLSFMAYMCLLTWMGSIVGHLVVLHKSRIHWVKVGPSGLKESFQSGGAVFVSQIGSLVISNTCLLILGWGKGEMAAGAYSIAEKLVRAAISLTAPISTALYPQSARLFLGDKEAGVVFLRKYMKLTLPPVALGSVLLFVLADHLVELVSGKRIPEAGLCIRIMAITPISIVLDNFYGTQLLLNLGHSRRFLQGTLGGAAVGLALQAILIPSWGAAGAAGAFLLAELVVLLVFVIGARRIGISLIPPLGI